jgi:glycine cleavage system T protein
MIGGTMSDELRKTQLYQWHVDHGGRMVPFAGWEMPVQYTTGPIEEHHITRRSAGLFDIHHMGEVEVTGPDAESFLNLVMTWDVSAMATNDAHYSLMCHKDGGVVDDVFVYRLPDRWFVVINAANRPKDVDWLTKHAANFDVSLTDVSDETYMLALQGPNAIALLDKLTPADINAMLRFTAVQTEIDGTAVLVGRTGYTGEDGVELFFAANDALKIWELLLATGPANGIEIAPVGLAARDSLRFEPAFPLYGHEISDTITPLEARLGWACSFEKEFIGREALLKQKDAGLTRKIIGFELTERGVPRQDYAVANLDGEEIGVVVTGLYAPSVGKYCGNALVSAKYAKLGTPLQIIIRNKPKAAIVSKRPFYKPAYR